MFHNRAIHLEVLQSLEADSFLNGSLRFTARRGFPVNVWSDNGTNIVGAYTELSRSLQRLGRRKVIHAVRRSDVAWGLNPPHASHHGGVWERVIRTVRRVLLAVLDLSPNLTDEVLHTTLYYVKWEILLTVDQSLKCSDDANDDAALTHNHLLLLRDNAALELGNFHHSDLYKKRWRQVQYLSSVFGKRWVKEYLPLLHQGKNGGLQNITYQSGILY